MSANQNRPLLRTLSMAVVVLGVTSLAFAAEGPFVSVNFKDACAQAEKAKKPVFIDFYTTWCGPCKMLDQTTWKDKAVVAWLSEKTVALKLDAEKEVDLAKKYKVTAYPTLLFIKSDGTELARILGYMPPEEFLDEAKGALTGKDAMTRAREKVEGDGKNDPAAQMRMPRLLAQGNKNEEALQQLLWCFDEGHKHDPEFAEARLSFVLANIIQMGKSYPPAQKAIEERFEAAQKGLKAEKASADQVGEFVAINRFLGKNQESLDFYDQLRKDKPKSKMVPLLQSSLLEQLVELHRYAEIAEGSGLKTKIEEAFKAYKPAPAGEASASGAANPNEQPADFQTQRFSYQVGLYYQILLGAKKTKEADALASRMLKVYSTADAYNSLAWNGYLTTAATEANLTQARKAYDLTKGKNVAIVDTLARVLHARGKQDEAVKLVKKTLELPVSEWEKRVLNACLDEVKKEP